MAKKSPVKRSDVKPKAKKGAKSASPVASDFSLVFEGLKKVLRAFEPELRVTADERRKYYLVTKSNN